MGWISWLCPGINLKRWLAAFRRRRTVLRHRLGTIFQLSIYGLCRRNAFSHVLSYYR